jgi:NitT/TauT family transport system ATP-binding protein
MQMVDKTFNGSVAALRRMNLTVREGDFISLLGPSGCGKSTALRLIAGLMRPTGGRITWEGEVGERVEEVLALVGLERFAEAYPRELSGGMKMRVSIARALVTRPRLILMDEPFAALDEITRQKLNNDLLELKAKTGSTVIFVTHSVFESVFLSDRILIMAPRPGRVVEEIAVDAPYPRDLAFRTSAQYGALARAASDALMAAMGGELMEDEAHG